ncbi:hypothetical protein DESPIG_00772 [Desulfovibrio piger ATCC 29098]|uniref:Uncharacterized protein n=1 Tax=Desulfovibrio piger ATCC 29098 TaxID=411464 RepID=B6WRT1_9BACT|nr:hypothetical protein DESPIG_00772 [Desulfovibrio piger ATCC 29098]
MCKLLNFHNLSIQYWLTLVHKKMNKIEEMAKKKPPKRFLLGYGNHPSEASSLLGCRRRILELVIFASLLPFLPPLGFSLCIGEAFPLTSAGLRAIAVFPVGLVRCPANWADSLFFPAFFIAHGIHRILMLDVVGHPLCAIDSFYCIRGTRRAVALIRPDDSVWRATDGTAIRAAKFSHIPRPFTGLVRCRLFFSPLQAALGAIPCAWAAHKRHAACTADTLPQRAVLHPLLLSYLDSPGGSWSSFLAGRFRGDFSPRPH